MKTKKELDELKTQCTDLQNELASLTPEELEQVFGGYPFAVSLKKIEDPKIGKFFLQEDKG